MSVSRQDLDWKSYIATYCQGVRQFILKEEDKNERARRRINV